jgi:hypothetical protein
MQSIPRLQKKGHREVAFFLAAGAALAVRLKSLYLPSRPVGLGVGWHSRRLPGSYHIKSSGIL